MSPNDRGCVKTLPTAVSAQQKNSNLPSSRETFHAPTTFRLNQSAPETTERTVFAQPRPKKVVDRCAAHEMLRKISKCSLWRERRICLSLTALAITTFGNTRGIAYSANNGGTNELTTRTEHGRSTPRRTKVVKDRNGVTLFIPMAPPFAAMWCPTSSDEGRSAMPSTVTRNSTN